MAMLLRFSTSMATSASSAPVRKDFISTICAFCLGTDLRFEGKRPLLLSSVVQDDNAALSVNLDEPRCSFADGIISLPRDTIAIERTKFLWQGGLL